MQRMSQEYFSKKNLSALLNIFWKTKRFWYLVNLKTKNFRSLAIVDFQSICVKDENLEDTETATRIEKRLPKPVPKSFNLLEDLMFPWDFILGDLSSTFVDPPENHATKGKGKLKMKSLGVETTLWSNFGETLENTTPNRTQSSNIEEDRLESNSDNVSTQFLQMQKSQLILITLWVIAVQQKSLDSTSQSTIPTGAKLVCSPLLLMNDTLKK